MTYCAGLLVREGLVMIADTRTNAGLDNISTFRKLHQFEIAGERSLAIATAGNLSISQSVLSLITEGLPHEHGEGLETIYSAPTMFRAAQLIGRAIREVRHTDGKELDESGVKFDVSILLGGQIKGGPARLYMLYSAGNFIECGVETPYLQIGEHKYGKPILDRAVNFETTLPVALKLALISMDSTIRSNLSVGPPLDLLCLKRDALRVLVHRSIAADDEYFRMIRSGWGESLRHAFHALPNPTL